MPGNWLRTVFGNLAAVSVFLIALGLMLCCSGCGGGGGGPAALNPVSSPGGGFTLSGRVSWETASGTSLRAALPALTGLRVRPRDRVGAPLGAAVPVDADGRFTIAGLVASGEVELAVLDPTDRVLLLRLLAPLSGDRADLPVDPDSTALAVLHRLAGGARTIAELETALAETALTVGPIVDEIKRWAEQPPASGTATDVETQVTAALGAVALQGLIDAAFPAGSDPIRLIRPAAGTILTLGADLECEAAVGFREPWKKIEFYQNGYKIGEVATRPYLCSWSRPPVGSYSLEAKLVLSDWSRLVSPAVAVEVREGANRPPATPLVLSPASGATGLFATFEARCASFTDPDAGDYHRSSDWQVSRDAAFSPGAIAWERLATFDGRERVTVSGLATGTSYWLRVRHRDPSEAVSSWSTAIPLETMGFAPTADWLRCFGGSADEVPIAALALDDGGLVVLATSESADGDVGRSNGNRDIWVFRLDALGNLLWKTVIGGVGPDDAHGIVAAPGGGFALLASSDSPDGEFADFDAQGQVRLGFRTLIQELGADGAMGKGYFVYPPLLDFPVGLVADPSGVFLVGGNSSRRDGGYTAEAPFATVLRFAPGPRLLGLWNGREWNGTTLAQLAPCVGQNFSTVGIAVPPGSSIGSGTVMKGFGVVSTIGLDGRMNTRTVVAENELTLDSRGPSRFPLRSAGTAGGGTLVTFPDGLNGVVVRQNVAAGEDWRRTLSLFRPLAVVERSSGRGLVAGIAPPAVGERGWCRMVQLDPYGNVLGRRSFGGTRNAVEYVGAVCPAADGGFFTISYTESVDGDVQGNHGGSDILIGKWQDRAE